MDYVKYIILVLVVLLVDGDASGRGDTHHDHVKLHVPEFVHHDHHTKVITIHHHHHKPKKEHHHHKPIIPYGPPKFHQTHHHSKSSSHTVSKGHTSVGKKVHGNHGHHGRHGHSGHSSHSGHDGYNGYKYHDAPSYDLPSTNYDPPTVKYAPPSSSYSPSPSYASEHGFPPAAPDIPAPRLHGLVHTVQQVQVFDSLPGALNTGSAGYQVTEHGNEYEEDVFTSVNSLSQSYPGTLGHLSGAAEQNDPFSDTNIAHSSSHQPPNTNPFANAQQQPSYMSLEDFQIQSQSGQSIPSVQPSYSAATGYSNGHNSDIGNDLSGPSYSEVAGYNSADNSVIGNDLSGASVLSFAEADQDDTPVSFSRETGSQRAIDAGGIQTVAY